MPLDVPLVLYVKPRSAIPVPKSLRQIDISALSLVEQMGTQSIMELQANISLLSGEQKIHRQFDDESVLVREHEVHQRSDGENELA